MLPGPCQVPLYMFGSVTDLVDSYLKGGFDYFVESAGLAGWTFTLLAFPTGIIGIKTRRLIFHNWADFMFAVLQYALGFGVITTLLN